ncbi:MAG: hypothetical protein U1F81_19365 [Verrucomicrobiaceae bacterium]
MRLQHLLVEQVGFRGLSDTGIIHEAGKQNHLAEIGSRLGQRHRHRAAKDLRRTQHAGMPRVADLMRERDHVMHGLMNGHVNLPVLLELRAGAERAGSLARPRLRLDPAIFASISRKWPRARIRGAEGLIDRFGSLRPNRAASPPARRSAALRGQSSAKQLFL